MEARGKGQASRQVNKILTPDVWTHADKLCCVEIVTPDGNWWDLLLELLIFFMLSTA